MTELWTWFTEHNISTHTIAAIAVVLGMAYAGFPPFHALVMKYFGMLPSDLQTLVLTGFFIGALYKSGTLKFVTTTTTTLETKTTVVPAPTEK
jgi:hypothetical protein